MKSVKIIGIIILWISLHWSVAAQRADYMSRLETVYDSHKHSSTYFSYVQKAGNPVEFLFASLFVGYKLVFSSQDMDSCVFYPSCSVYGIQSIQKKGIIIGTMKAFDRLTRCHPFAGSKYPFLASKNSLYDPVD